MLQKTEAAFDALPFDVQVERGYGRIVAAVVQIGRKPRGPRMVDLLIAATALSNNLPLITRNPKDFAGLENLVEMSFSRPAPISGQTPYAVHTAHLGTPRLLSDTDDGTVCQAI